MNNQGIELAKLKQKNKELKKDLFDLKEDIKKDKLREKDLLNKISELEKSLSVKDTIISSKDKEIETLNNVIEADKRVKQSLQSKEKQAKEDLIRYKNSAEYRELTKREKSLISENTSLKKDLWRVKHELKLEKAKPYNLSLEDYIRLISEKLTPVTVHSNFNKLTQLVSLIDRCKSNYSKSLRVVKKDKSKELDIQLLGYINLNDANNECNMIFTSLDGVKYTINTDTSQVKDMYKLIGSPCRAVVLDDNTVELYEIYSCEEHMKHANRNNAKLKDKDRDKDKDKLSLNFRYDKTISILIIGNNRHMKAYNNAFNKVGLEVEWVDSFEMNIERIKAMYGRFDILIALADSCRSIVTSDLDEDVKDKMIIVRNERKELLLSCINGEIHRRGLANIIND